MLQQVPIDINPIDNPTGDRKAEFNPQTQTVMVGDLIFWVNNDENFTHQPKPKGGATGDWVKRPISKKVGDLPGTSNTLSFQAATPPSGVAYVCALHPAETGILIVLAN